MTRPENTSGAWPVVITCEHATAHVPEDLWPHFHAATHVLDGDATAVLHSHRGFDAGALDVAEMLVQQVGVAVLAGETSRLVVDLNRSLHHPRLLSPVTRALPKQAQQHIIARFWRPHRHRVERAVEHLVRNRGLCLHLAMHSFTPVWQGAERNVDVGLLYDPQRATEVRLASHIAQALTKTHPMLRVRRNQPYRGTSDGVPTALRRVWADPLYGGLELEVNQKWVHNRTLWPEMCRAIASACVVGLDKFA